MSEQAEKASREHLGRIVIRFISRHLTEVCKCFIIFSPNRIIDRRDSKAEGVDHGNGDPKLLTPSQTRRNTNLRSETV